MPIHPLPQFEADLETYLKEKEDREAYEKLNAPSTIVVRFGYLRMIGEFPYSGDTKPGCGSKLVVATHRGTEIGEMLTSTCANSGCGKSVTRKEMLKYIENSGGRQYPFFDRGRVLRVASADDLNRQHQLEQRKNEFRMIARGLVEKAGLEMKIIEVEPILGNERVMIYFGAEDRVDFRDLVQELVRAIGTKVELRQIGARDEARITADYERCGQYCCCKSFLKVLKPVSMKSAKIQKATLDPLKISGRCGRLMCCLRYEDETYEALRKNLPHRKSRVGTPEGDGIVISTQILTQLALVRLDNHTDVAIPIEELTEPESKAAPEPGASSKARATRSPKRAERTERTERTEQARGTRRRGRDESEAGSLDVASSDNESGRSRRRSSRRGRSKDAQRTSDGEKALGQRRAARPNASRTADRAAERAAEPGDDSTQIGDRPKKKRRRRRRRNTQGGASGTAGTTETAGNQSASPSPNPSPNPSGDRMGDRSSGRSGSGSGSGSGPVGSSGSGAKKKKRRRRRRRGSGQSESGGPDSTSND